MGAALGFLAGGIQTISGINQANSATNALMNYDRQELENVNRNRRVSTLGADLRREELQRASASQIEALQGAGSRGIIGGAGRVDEMVSRGAREIGADLDMQQIAIDRDFAEDEAKIRAMQENREMQDIAALSSQIQQGQQNTLYGAGNIIRSADPLIDKVGGLFGKEEKETPLGDLDMVDSTNAGKSFRGTRSGGSGIGSLPSDNIFDPLNFDTREAGTPITTTPVRGSNRFSLMDYYEDLYR